MHGSIADAHCARTTARAKKEEEDTDWRAAAARRTPKSPPVGRESSGVPKLASEFSLVVCPPVRPSS